MHVSFAFMFNICLEIHIKIVKTVNPFMAKTFKEVLQICPCLRLH